MPVSSNVEEPFGPKPEPTGPEPVGPDSFVEVVFGPFGPGPVRPEKIEPYGPDLKEPVGPFNKEPGGPNSTFVEVAGPFGPSYVCRQSTGVTEGMDIWASALCMLEVGEKLEALGTPVVEPTAFDVSGMVPPDSPPFEAIRVPSCLSQLGQV